MPYCSHHARGIHELFKFLEESTSPRRCQKTEKWQWNRPKLFDNCLCKTCNCQTPQRTGLHWAPFSPAVAPAQGAPALCVRFALRDQCSLKRRPARRAWRISLILWLHRFFRLAAPGRPHFKSLPLPLWVSNGEEHPMSGKDGQASCLE